MNKQYAIAIIILIAVFLLGFFVRGWVMKEREVMAPATIDLDSVKAVAITGMVDYLTYQEAIDRIEALRNTVGIPGAGDTIVVAEIINGMGDAGATVVRSTLDTAFNLRGDFFYTLGSDTLGAEIRPKIRIKLAHLGDPLNTFLVEKLAMDPYHFEIPIRERLVVESEGWLNLSAFPGFMDGSAMMGVAMDIKGYGAGIMVSPDNSPGYFLTFRKKIL